MIFNHLQLNRHHPELQWCYRLGYFSCSAKPKPKCKCSRRGGGDMESPPQENQITLCFVAKTFGAMTSTLGSFLDSALFLALTVQIATASLYLGANGGQQNFSQYDGTLLMYTAIIPICPVLTLINTPGFRNTIRRCDFRLFTITVVTVLAGCVIILGTTDLLSNATKLDKATAENQPDPFRCVSSFLMRIMPADAETKVLRCFCVLVFIALLFALALRLEIGLKRINKKKTAASCGKRNEGETGMPTEPHSTDSTASTPHNTANSNKVNDDGRGADDDGTGGGNSGPGGEERLRPARPASVDTQLTATPEFEEPLLRDSANSGDGSGQENPKDFTSTKERETTKQKPPVETRKTVFVVLWTLYIPVYLALQFLPIYLLLRIFWMRGQVRSIINPDIAAKYDPDIEKYKGEFFEAWSSWDDDDWGFGQIMSLSLWLPTILETVYLTIGMAQLFQLVLYVRLANWGLVTIVGEERGLTERLPQPWVAALTGSNTPSAPGPGEP